MSRLPLNFFLVAMGGGAFAAAAVAKILFKLGPPLPGPAAPTYCLAAGLFVALVALADGSSRGLVFAAIGGILASAAAVALIPTSKTTMLVWSAGLPLVTVGAVGLAMFAHGYLHGRPATGGRGLQLVVIGAVISVVLFLYVVILIRVRAEVHGTPTGMAMNAIAAGAGLAILVMGLVFGRRAIKKPG